MFGYIRTFQPHLRICEFETYKSVYCGLCKYLGKEYGMISRLTLSYDFTFLVLLAMSVNETDLKICSERCIVHPFKKRRCVKDNIDYEYTAATAVITIYHKLKDNLHDKGFKNKILSLCMLPFVKRQYKKASKRCEHLSSVVEENMLLQNKIEKENCNSIDMASEPTAAIMAEIAEGISDNQEKKQHLKRLGYLLGRYVYMCDALDDIQKDNKKHNYNTLLNIYAKNGLDKHNMSKINEFAQVSVNYTLSELAEAYVELGLEKYKPILDNIIYLGLNNTFNQISKGDCKNHGRSI